MKMTRPLLALAALAILLAIGFAEWAKGWVVAKAGYVQVRKVPIPDGWFVFPGYNEYCYVIEVGNYPYNSTFRVQWDSYEAEKVEVQFLEDKPYFRVIFDNGFSVKGQANGPGDLSIAKWEMQSKW